MSTIIILESISVALATAVLAQPVCAWLVG